MGFTIYTKVNILLVLHVDDQVDDQVDVHAKVGKPVLRPKLPCFVVNTPLRYTYITLHRTIIITLYFL
jgi:hypothetical protein